MLRKYKKIIQNSGTNFIKVMILIVSIATFSNNITCLEIVTVKKTLMIVKLNNKML